MALPISNNPYVTRGKENGSNAPIHLQYPTNEVMSSYTRLRFVRYSRINPGDTAGEETRATISLPLPVNIPENYSVNITGHDLGAYGMISNKNIDKAMTSWDSGLAEIIKDGSAGITDAIRGQGFNTAQAAAGLVAATASNDTARSAQSFTGIVKNPHTTVVFDGVNLRTINLEWRFSARSEEDSRMIKRVSDTIRLLSHPEEIANGYALNYPDLLYVEFDGKAKEYLPKYRKAMVNSIHITPDSNAGIPLYKSGAPVSYNFQLVATETEILTRNIINEQIGGQ